MRKIFFCLVLCYSCSGSANEDSLNSFSKALDKTLRHLNRSESRPCNSDNSLTPSSADLVLFEKKAVTALSKKDAQNLFYDLKNKSDIPFEFSLAGCEQRAHEMSRLLLLKGITPLKAFVSVDEDESPRLQVPHPQKKGHIIRWKYHVAPVVLVKENGQLVPYVIDPSIENKIVPLSEWRSHMTRHDPKIKVRTEITTANQFDVDGRLKPDFKDQDFNRSNQESLREFKKYSQDPDGEENYLFQLQRNEERMMMIDSSEY